jgi:hypothetical protein
MSRTPDAPREFLTSPAGLPMANKFTSPWFQFRVLDLVLLTTVTAVVLVLCRPIPAARCKAKPWLVGVWDTPLGAVIPLDDRDRVVLYLLPDGYYRYSPRTFTEEGRWVASTGAGDTSILQCGRHRFVVRTDWGSGVLDLLNEDGSLQLRLETLCRLEGPVCHSVPDGEWRSIPVAPGGWAASLTYECGRLVDLLEQSTNKRDLCTLNRVRAVHGLPELTDRDFSNEEAVPQP